MTADPPTAASELVLDISSVERDTGLSKDVLRMWERRYGFPKPARDENGERQYSAAEVAKLRTIKRLMDVGLRPGRIVGGTQQELDALAGRRTRPANEAPPPALADEVLGLLMRHDFAGLQRVLARELMRQGLQRFVLDAMTPINRAVGDAWMRGELQVFQEHLHTEQLQVALRIAINAFPRPPGPPRVLLTTLPGEQHGLGLLMVEGLLVPEGVQCISLGMQTPLEDIRRAVLAYAADIVVLSFSALFPLRQASDGLAALRRQLPLEVSLWAGGEMTRRLRRTLAGVQLLPDLGATLPALAAWRARASEAGSSRDPAASTP